MNQRQTRIALILLDGLCERAALVIPYITVGGLEVLGAKGLVVLSKFGVFR